MTIEYFIFSILNVFSAVKDKRVYLPPIFVFSFHYQLEATGLSTGLVLVMEDERMIDILFNTGSKNSTAVLVVSLWQEMKLLQGLVPTSLQVNLTYFTLMPWEDHCGISVIMITHIAFLQLSPNNIYCNY